MRAPPPLPLLAALLLVLGAASAASAPLPERWPEPAAVAGLAGAPVAFPSLSPFALADLDRPERVEATTAQATLFLPPQASAARPVPAVVMLHGSGGVLAARELTYGRQLAAMGVAALVVDAFGARRDKATAFLERLIAITETMLLADAYAALAYLAARPEIDAGRIVLIGFSYGGMAATYALYEQVAARLAPTGLRFAGHVAFYAPCIVRFADSRTTGAPLLMLSGAEDAIVDPARCAEVADELRAGGSAVESIVYAGAYHQWDGGFAGPRQIGRNLAGCRLRVGTDGVARDRRTFLPMVDGFTRKLILGLCAGREGYLIGRDDAVRARSNADLARFLNAVFARDAAAAGGPAPAGG